MPTHETHSLENGMFFAKSDAKGGNWISIGSPVSVDITIADESTGEEYDAGVLNLSELYDIKLTADLHGKKISRKRLKKILMSMGVSRNSAEFWTRIINKKKIKYGDALLHYMFEGMGYFVRMIGLL